MTKPLRNAIQERRRLLQNPYAYVDELDEMNSIRAHRQRLENPYALIEDLSRVDGLVGRFDGVSELSAPNKSVAPIKKKEKYRESEIERTARDFQRAMWNDRSKIFPDSTRIDPLDMLDPRVAFHYLGYEFEFSETLGQFNQQGTLHEVAGTVDQNRRRVQISSQFPRSVRNFTAAHELGHALLHDSVGLHRDRPLSGASTRREQREYEADKFATYFLMPRKLVIARFETQFGHSPFTLNEQTRFALLGAAAKDSKKLPGTLRELSRLLASVTRFNGRELFSIADQFRVSAETMAIRLEELGLIAQT